MPGPAWNLMDPNAQPDFATFLAQQQGMAAPQMPVTQTALNAASPRAALPQQRTNVSRETRKFGANPLAGATQNLLQTIDERSRAALDSQGADVAKLQTQAQDLTDKSLPLNLSALAGLTDAWTGSHLAATSAPEETEATRRAEVERLNAAVLKAKQGMSQDEIAILKDKLSGQWHAEDIAQRGADRQVQRDGMAMTAGLARDAKTQKRNEDDLVKMSQDLDPSRASSRTGLGVALQKVTNAQALKALASGQGSNLPSAQVEELAIGLNRLVSGSSAGVTQVRNLVPESARGDAQKLKSWLFNEPYGTEQQKFVEKIMETVDREARLANNQIQDYQRGKLPAWKAKLGHLPGYSDVLKGYEQNYGVSLRDEPDQGEVVDGHVYLKKPGLKANDPANWKEVGAP